MPKIRIINLVDILLVLLMFLFATTTFRSETPSAVKLSLPEAKTAEAVGQQQVHRLLITVAPDEAIYLNQEPVRLERLEGVLRRAREQNPEVVLQLSADKRVSYGRVVAIVDAARGAGISDLTAFTKKTAEQ
ncbi:biopolymer transporter ExbD [bacterium]|nr:biopolymer transporter ExbD [bacterium]